MSSVWDPDYDERRNLGGGTITPGGGGGTDDSNDTGDTGEGWGAMGTGDTADSGDAVTGSDRRDGESTADYYARLAQEQGETADPVDPVEPADPVEENRSNVAPLPPSGGGNSGPDINVDYTVPEAGEGPGASESSGTGNDPTMTPWEVTDEQTVAGQMEKNYDRNSPFMEKAAEEGQRKHLASGGQNSLMAGKAGQVAAMDVAFKMSFADAKTYARSAEFNAAMKNQFGLAEQRFIQNSLLSEQNFNQAIVMQTQMIAGQLEGIAAQYRGKGMLMDKEFDQFFDKAQYTAQLKEYAEMNGYQRAVALQGVISRGNFMSQGFDSVMQYANNPNFTPEQSAAAARSGMGWMSETFDIMDSFWASVGSPSDGQPTFPGQYDWWDYSGG